MKTIEAYECDHCKRVLKTKHGMKQHEGQCYANPESCSCMTCGHFCYDVNFSPRCNDIESPFHDEYLYNEFGEACGDPPHPNFQTNCNFWIEREEKHFEGATEKKLIKKWNVYVPNFFDPPDDPSLDYYPF
jgi:hypothetical protein